MRRGNQEQHRITVVSVPAMLGDGENVMSNGTVPKEHDHKLSKRGSRAEIKWKAIK